MALVEVKLLIPGEPSRWVLLPRVPCKEEAIRIEKKWLWVSSVLYEVDSVGQTTEIIITTRT